MAVPSSGQLKLWDTLWNDELGGSKGENSLHSASVYAGFSTPDALSDFYGWSDVEVPTLNTLSATSVSYSSATVRGEVTNTGNENPTVGTYTGTSNSYTSNTKYTSGTCGVGPFSQNITGLSQISNYKTRAWGSNSAGEAVAPNQLTFTTNEQPFGVGFSNATQGYGGQFPSGNSSGIAIYWVNPYSGGNNFISSATGGGFVRCQYTQYSNNTLNRFYANTNGVQMGIGIQEASNLSGCFFRTTGGNISGTFCYGG
jgi:hypothetical protein